MLLVVLLFDISHALLQFFLETLDMNLVFITELILELFFFDYPRIRDTIYMGVVFEPSSWTYLIKEFSLYSPAS